MLISIITINYNNVAGLERTIKSVQEQTATNYEHILIDGGSTDGSKELILENEESFSYWVSESDNGIYQAMNKGVLVAKGKYLLFLNSGDELYTKNTMADAIIELATQNIDLVYGDLEIVNGENRRKHKFPNKISLFYLFAKSLGHPSTFIKRSLFSVVGLYNEQSTIIGDWEWFTLALGLYQVSNKRMNIVVSTFYLDGISSIPQNQELIQKQRIIFLKSYFPNLISDFEEYQQNLNSISRVESILGHSFLKLMNRYLFKKSAKILVRIAHLFYGTKLEKL